MKDRQNYFADLFYNEMILAKKVIAVSLSAAHTFSKIPQASITLDVGLGVRGDAHYGATVKHRSRVAIDPTQPNLRQVHLVQAEVFDELRPSGFNLFAGAIGENILTSGVDLLHLPVGTRLRIGESAIIELTGLRNPCVQLDTYQSGLLKAMIGKDDDGNVIRKSGVMGVVITAGDVCAGDDIRIELPPLPHRAMERI